jgi:hypothetical protein
MPGAARYRSGLEFGPIYQGLTLPTLILLMDGFSE